MNCLKCGRETDQTFCECCRKEMARYPVRPGTIVQLPKDRTASSPRDNQDWRNGTSLEKQIENQKRSIRRLRRAVVVLTLLLAVMAAGMFWILGGENQPRPGQNYSTVTKPSEDPTQPTTGPEISGAVG